MQRSKRGFGERPIAEEGDVHASRIFDGPPTSRSPCVRRVSPLRKRLPQNPPPLWGRWRAKRAGGGWRSFDKAIGFNALPPSGSSDFVGFATSPTRGEDSLAPHPRGDLTTRGIITSE